MSNFKTGKELIQEWKIKDFELFEHVKAGLQPHDQLGRPLSPPDISPKLYTLRTVKKSLDDLLRSNPPGRLTREKLQELFEEHPSKAFGEVYYTEKAQKEFTRLSGEKERIEKELSGIDIHSWANYELPEDLQEARAIINSLLQACFHIEDINKILVPVRPQERAVTDTQNQMLDYEAFIRNLKISYKSGDEIKIQAPGKVSKVYTFEDMGFRKITDKRWGFLIDALNDGGLYRMESVPKDKIKLAEKIYATSAASPQTKYDQQQKRLKRLNEKLIDFFNDKFKLQMPKDFKLYERLSSDPPGQYRFKFSVIKGSLTQYEDEFKAYDKAQLIDEGVSLYKKLQKTPTTDQDALIKN